MLIKIFSTLACFSIVAQAGAQVNFDKGVDIKEALKQAQAVEVNKDQYPYYGGYRVRYSKDCETFRYGAYDSGSSARAYLESYEYIEECRFVPKPPSPPPPPKPVHNGPRPKSFYGHNDPWTQPGYQTGHEYSYYGQQNGREGTYYCRERIGQSFRNSAQMELAQRQLFPWESESFEVCLEGPRVDFNVRQSPYSYSVDRDGMYDLRYRLTPRYRVPTAPDSDGLYLSAWSQADGKFRLAVNDRWAREYAGEKVMVRVELIKDGFLFFNSKRGYKEFTFDAASGYELVFSESELTKDKDFDDSLDKADRGPKKYFAKWGFRRLGRISTDSYIGKRDTDKIPGN